MGKTRLYSLIFVNLDIVLKAISDDYSNAMNGLKCKIKKITNKIKKIGDPKIEEKEEDKLVTFKEATEELNINTYELLKKANYKKVVVTPLYDYGVNVFIRQSEVLRIKQQQNF